MGERRLHKHLKEVVINTLLDIPSCLVAKEYKINYETGKYGIVDIYATCNGHVFIGEVKTSVSEFYNNDTGRNFIENAYNVLIIPKGLELKLSERARTTMDNMPVNAIWQIDEEDKIILFKGDQNQWQTS